MGLSECFCFFVYIGFRFDGVYGGKDGRTMNKLAYINLYVKVRFRIAA